MKHGSPSKKSESLFEPKKSDSALTLLLDGPKLSENNAIKKIQDDMKKRWAKNYFPSTFPSSYINCRKTDQKAEVQNKFYWTLDFPSIKSLSHCHYMKVIIPECFNTLAETLLGNDENTHALSSTEITNAWDRQKHFVSRFDTSDQVDGKRTELLDDGNYNFVTRFDICNFHGSVYTHFMESLRLGSILEARQNFEEHSRNSSSPQTIEQETWAKALDAAIQATQHKETHGLPIGGSIFRTIGDLICIFLNDQALHLFDKNYKDINISQKGDANEGKTSSTDIIEDIGLKIHLVQYSDNTDVYSNSEETVKLVLDAFVRVLHNYQLSVNVFCTAMSKDPTCFGTMKNFNTLNTRSLNQYLSATSSDPDYPAIVDKVCKSFFEQQLCKSTSQPGNYMSDLANILKLHPLSINAFVNLAIEQHKTPHMQWAKLGTKLIIALQENNFRSLPTTQLICVLHYFLVFRDKIDPPIHRRLKNHLSKYELCKHPFVFWYMTELGFGIDCELDTTITNKFGGQWLFDQFQQAIKK